MDKIEVLTPLQKNVLGHLFADEWFRTHFYLTGGTALSAYYLFHRYSDDLDFFSHGVDLAPIHGIMNDLGKKSGIRIEKIQASPGFVRYEVGEGLKVDCVSDVDFRVGAPVLMEGHMIDCEKNIAVNKVCAILGRFDAKDYVDLFFIIREGSLDIFELLELAHKKDAGLDLFVWASLIADVENITVLPRIIKPVTLDDLKSFFFDLRDKILDKIKPR